MQDEQQSVHPLCAGLAKLRVNPLILGYEQTREEAQGNVDLKVDARIRPAYQPSKTCDHRERIQRMPDSLPRRQSALVVVVNLVDAHRYGLKGERHQ